MVADIRKHSLYTDGWQQNQTYTVAKLFDKPAVEGHEGLTP